MRSTGIAGSGVRVTPAFTPQGSGRLRSRMVPNYFIPVGLLLVLALLAVRLGRIDFADSRDYAFMDQYRYVAMAQHPFGLQELVHEPPFCWRLLAPLVVHVLPFPILTSFWLLTLGGLIGATLALMWFLRGLGLPPGATIAGGLAFVAMTYTTGFALWDYMLIEPLAFALLALTMACAVHRRGALLLLTLLALAATKETALLGGTFAVLWAWERRDARMLRWALAGFVGSLVVLIAIRFAVPADRPYSLIAELRLWSGIRHNPPSYFVNRAFAATMDTWNVLLPLAMLQLLHPPRIWRSPAFAITMLGAFAQVLIASDVQRLVIYGFPVVIAACGFEVEYLARQFNLSRWWIWAPAVLLELVWWVATYGTWYRAIDAPLTRAIIAANHWLIPLTIGALAVAVAMPRMPWFRMRVETS